MSQASTQSSQTGRQTRGAAAAAATTAPSSGSGLSSAPQLSFSRAEKLVARRLVGDVCLGQCEESQYDWQEGE